MSGNETTKYLYNIVKKMDMTQVKYFSFLLLLK